MITRNEVKQYVAEQTERFDPSMYKMGWDNFLGSMTNILFRRAYREELEIEEITQEMFDNAEDVVCTNYDSNKISDPDQYL